MNDFVEDRSVLSRPASPPDATVRFGARDENIADVRFGTDHPERAPLVIAIHGGYWRPQFDRAHTGPMCEAIAKSGWTVAAIEYRRIPGEPDATLEDVALAIHELPNKVQHHNGKFIVVGHSAGGHLALWTAAKCTAANFIGALALGPAADLRWGEAHAVGSGAVRAFLGKSAGARPDVDPVQMSSSVVAVTIVHGLQDQAAPIAMSENYVARHPKTRFVRLDDCGHFALIDPLALAWRTVVDELRRFK